MEVFRLVCTLAKLTFNRRETVKRPILQTGLQIFLNFFAGAQWRLQVACFSFNRRKCYAFEIYLRPDVQQHC